MMRGDGRTGTTSPISLRNPSSACSKNPFLTLTDERIVEGEVGREEFLGDSAGPCSVKMLSGS